MKLEIKHIAPYLPYGLRAITTKASYNNPMIGEIDYWNKNDEDELSISTGEGYYLCKIEECKPYFRPMSDLYKPLENGEVPIVELAKILGFEIIDYSDNKVLVSEYRNGEASCKEYLTYSKRHGVFEMLVEDDHYTSDSYNTRTISPYLHFDAYQYLFEHHFNVFNLPPHLWIDINTIP